MLFLQASKAHASVALIAQHGLMEDAATIARRLLEISIQGVYIGAEQDAKIRERKAGSYLAFLWRRLPRRVKSVIPAPVRMEWTSIGRSYGRFVPRRSKRWGPNWRAMFKECGSEDLYDTDYAFLSGIAHGSPEEQVFRFSMETIRVHDDRHVSPLLVYSSRYFAALGEVWNGHFDIITREDIEALRDRLVNWRFRKGAP